MTLFWKSSQISCAIRKDCHLLIYVGPQFFFYLIRYDIGSRRHRVGVQCVSLDLRDLTPYNDVDWIDCVQMFKIVLFICTSENLSCDHRSKRSKRWLADNRKAVMSNLFRRVYVQMKKAIAQLTLVINQIERNNDKASGLCDKLGHI